VDEEVHRLFALDAHLLKLFLLAIRVQGRQAFLNVIEEGRITANVWPVISDEIVQQTRNWDQILELHETTMTQRRLYDLIDEFGLNDLATGWLLDQNQRQGFAACLDAVLA